MKNITDLALRRPVTTIMVFVTVVLIGMIAATRLPLAFLPTLTGPQLWIEIPYPGSTPEEVERLITAPAEEALATVSGVKNIYSWSRESGAGISVQFDWGDEVELKGLEIREKLDGIRDQWPDDVERFFVYQWSSDDWAILNLRISSDKDLSNAYDLLNRNLKRPIERVNGISRVTLYGVEAKEVKISLLADRVAAYGIDLNVLMATLRKANFSVTAGQITDNNRRYAVRPVGEIRSAEELANLVVASPNIRLKDIAEITYAQPERNYGRHLDMKYAIGLEIFKEGTANTVEVTERVMAEIEKIKQNPEMSGIQLFIMDNQAEGIVSSIRELLKSGLIGAAFSFLILFYFLRQMTSTLVVALSVPFSLMVTLACMYFLDISLNILSMMGLMLAIGMLVDNAVVVTENIFRHRAKGGNPLEQTRKGVHEVSMAVVAGTATTAIVFLPNIVDQTDEISIQLSHVAVTIVISLAASLIISQTIVPLLTSRLNISQELGTKKTFINTLENLYERTLSWMISHKWWGATIILGTLFSVAIPASFVNSDMFPDGESRTFRIFYHIEGSYELETLEAAAFEMEEFLYENQKRFEIESVYSYFEEPSFVTSTVTLLDGDGAEKTASEIMDLIREEMPKMAIAAPTFDWRRENGGAEKIQVRLFGESSEVLTELSEEVARVLNNTPGFKDAESEAESGEEEVRIIVDRMRAQQLGVDPQQVARMVSTAMRGQNLPRFYTEEGETQVRIEFEGSDRQSIADLENMPVYLPNGETVKLAALADFQLKRGPSAIRRTNRITSMAVSTNLDEITSEEGREKLSQVMDRFNFPTGYSWGYGERFNFEQEAGQKMLVNTLLALVLIYLVMAALFESVLFPLSIWTSIVFAIVGVWWFFLITGTDFSFMAWIGILILIGIVVNNGIVLIDYVNQLRREGVVRNTAIIEAGKARLRPILMTAGTTILGLVPLCISNVAIGGSEGPPYFPMARAIVGGLLFSTMITVLILPNIYMMLDDMKLWSVRVIRLAKAPWKQLYFSREKPEESVAA